MGASMKNVPHESERSARRLTNPCSITQSIHQFLTCLVEKYGGEEKNKLVVFKSGLTEMIIMNDSTPSSQARSQANPVTLSVVMPAYNEEGAIRDAIAEIREHVFAVVADAELVCVNDGSRDATGRILDALAAEDARIRPLHQRNGGHGAALRAGLEAARGETLLLLDSDRQISLAQFAEHWPRMQQASAVLGVRTVRHDPQLRLVLTRWVRWVIAVLFAVRVRDANVPYKLVSRRAWQAAARYIPVETLAPSLFLALYLKAAGYRVEEVEIEHRPRLTGVSIRRWRLFKFCARAFAQLLHFRWRLPRARNSVSAPSAVDAPGRYAPSSPVCASKMGAR